MCFFIISACLTLCFADALLLICKSKSLGEETLVFLRTLRQVMAAIWFKPGRIVEFWHNGKDGEPTLICRCTVFRRVWGDASVWLRTVEDADVTFKLAFPWMFGELGKNGAYIVIKNKRGKIIRKFRKKL